MRRDKKLAQKKKARAQANAAARHKASLSPSAQLRSAPFGPAFIAGDWQSKEVLPPPLITVIVTKKHPQGLYVPQILLVDRTCTGIKNAFVGDRVSSSDLARLVEKVALGHGGVFAEVPVLTAQSIVFAAIDYGKRLGFRPHHDFEEAIVLPRPEELEPTPLAARARPFYCAGPNDDQEYIVELLTDAIGEDGFDAQLRPESDERDAIVYGRDPDFQAFLDARAKERAEGAVE